MKPSSNETASSDPSRATRARLASATMKKSLVGDRRLPRVTTTVIWPRNPRIAAASNGPATAAARWAFARRPPTKADIESAKQSQTAIPIDWLGRGEPKIRGARW